MEDKRIHHDLYFRVKQVAGNESRGAICIECSRDFCREFRHKVSKLAKFGVCKQSSREWDLKME